MNAIRRLPEYLVNQIAAGEVIERPAAVVKELVENAIDAGSKQVQVWVQGDGQALIQVSDDGRGMTAAEAVLALERHATSKLPSDDLSHITTLGFRGEALPAIAAVSRLTLTTQHAEQPAITVVVEGGTITQPVQPAPPRCGTVITVRDLFYATPARLKFLKSARSEVAAIVDVLTRLALAYPTVGLTLRLDDRERLALLPAAAAHAATAWRDRVRTVMGEAFWEHSVPVAASVEGMSLDGWVARPTWHHATQAWQYLLVNQRPLRDKLMLAAVRAGYHDLLPAGRYPAVVLRLTIDPTAVDMNVHPTKAEVRFRDANMVRDMIRRSVRDALAQGSQTSAAGFTTPALAPVLTLREESFDSVAAAVPLMAPSYSADNDAGLWRQQPLGEALAQIARTYIIAETASGMVLVDQHAAHERIVYEQLKSSYAAATPKTQLLLIPQVVRLTSEQVQALQAQAGELQKIGLRFEVLNETVLALQEVPALLVDADWPAIITDLAALYSDDQAVPDADAPAHRVCSRVACHYSVRAGRQLNTTEMNALLRQMEQTPNTGQCNHGRPTHIILTRDELEKLFARR